MIESSLPYKSIFRHFSHLLEDDEPASSIDAVDTGNDLDGVGETSDHDDDDGDNDEEETDNFDSLAVTANANINGRRDAPTKKTTTKSKKTLKPIDDEEWLSLKQMLDFMKPFEEYTIALSARNTMTISDVIPMQMNLLDKLRNVERNPSQYHSKVVAANGSMMSTYRKYYANSSPAYKLGHVLDPRFKLKYMAMESASLASDASNILRTRIRSATITKGSRIENSRQQQQ